MTFDEFIKRFSTEEQCRDYLFQLRWPNGFECPRCGCKEYRPLRHTLFDCKACKYQVQVCGHNLSRHKNAVKNLVYCHLVDYNAKIRRKRGGAATNPRFGQLRNRMDMASQNQEGYGSLG